METWEVRVWPRCLVTSQCARPQFGVPLGCQLSDNAAAPAQLEQYRAYNVTRRNLVSLPRHSVLQDTLPFTQTPCDICWCPMHLINSSRIGPHCHKAFCDLAQLQIFCTHHKLCCAFFVVKTSGIPPQLAIPAESTVLSCRCSSFT